MAASLRPGVSARLFAVVNRLNLQPVYLSRALCKVPPEASEQSDGMKAADSGSITETEEKLPKSQNLEAQTRKNLEPSEETELLQKKADSPDVVSNEVPNSSIQGDHLGPEKSAARSQDSAADRRAATQKKLHDLLSSLATADPIPVEPRVQLSRPKARQKRMNKTVEEEEDKKEPPVSPNADLDPELVSATKEVAESLGGDVKTTESELLSTLRLHSPEAASRSPASLSELFVGMKVERNPKPQVKELPPRQKHLDTAATEQHHTPSGDQPRLPRRTPHPRQSGISAPRSRMDLFGAEPLGIFSSGQERITTTMAPEDSHPSSVLPTWERMHQQELQQSVSHPPSNAFVEMIQWTNQGKLWTFPIDNETGLEEEKKVGFHEHLFLEGHLEGWCPQRGPIRHFMELVCTGLSKNPYLTVQRKQAHIEWYKNYFAQKEELLKEIGAIESTQ